MRSMRSVRSRGIEGKGRKTGLILTGGRVDLAFAGEFLQGPGRDADCIVSVDAGLETTKRLGLVPHAVVGDFDTVDREVLEEYRKKPGILWDVHRPEKDETDTQLAIHAAMKMGCGRLLILGATGGRLDHELSNIHLLKLCLDHQVEAFLYDPWNKVYLVADAMEFRRDEMFGTYVSFIPLTERVRGITLRGFKYPLTGRDISMGEEAGLCVSNEVAEERARIRLDSGILVCVESRDRGR